jgi:hypothetical protein
MFHNIKTENYQRNKNNEMSKKVTQKKALGQPKKNDPRTHQMRMMLNNKEKALFLKHGITKTHKLREWLLMQIEKHDIDLNDFVRNR